VFTDRQCSESSPGENRSMHSSTQQIACSVTSEKSVSED
jgi:hypothetical protein